MPVAAILLAAGSSSRMGQSKQLLPWKDGTLISNAIKVAIESRVEHVYVVLGSNEEKHRKEIEKFPVTVINNTSWKKGMGSSLKAGLMAAKDSEAVLIMVCDQPFVTSEHLNNMIDLFDHNVVASTYQETIGVPALFGEKLFDELMLIGDDEGARKIITQHNPILIHLDSGADIDTPDDYEKFLSN